VGRDTKVKIPFENMSLSTLGESAARAALQRLLVVIEIVVNKAEGERECPVRESARGPFTERSPEDVGTKGTLTFGSRLKKESARLGKSKHRCV